MKPAIVEYQGRSSKKFTKGKQYEAFFLEYWEGVRNSLHVRGNDGRVTDFNPFEYFAIFLFFPLWNFSLNWDRGQF